MKITNIETYPVWGGYRNFLFVVVDTDEGPRKDTTTARQAR